MVKSVVIPDANTVIPLVRRGRPPTGNARELVSLRLDRDVLVKLREFGPGWQSQVNPILRAILRLDTELTKG